MYEFFFTAGVTPDMLIIPWWMLAIGIAVFLVCVFIYAKWKTGKVTLVK
tara:strand:- start:35787 stop:35933 length:147 start_codon:yes stop_codon:yes gene_type:complete